MLVKQFIVNYMGTFQPDENHVFALVTVRYYQR
jgi:hypothetical protein